MTNEISSPESLDYHIIIPAGLSNINKEYYTHEQEKKKRGEAQKSESGKWQTASRVYTHIQHPALLQRGIDPFRRFHIQGCLYDDGCYTCTVLSLMPTSSKSPITS